MTTLRSLRSVRSGLLASLLAGFVALPSQDPAMPPRGPSGRNPVQAQAPTLNLVFQGGAFGSLCDQLVEAGKSVGANVNIVIDREATKAEVPPFQVRGAEVEQILEAACAAGSRPDQLLQVENRRGSAASIYVVTAQQIDKGEPPAAKDREATAVHSLAALLKDDERGIGFAPATILSAIETATTEQPLRALRYHTDSRLLIARGTKDSLAVVAEVLRELDKDLRRQAQPRKPSQPGPAGPQSDPSKDHAETR